MASDEFDFGPPRGGFAKPEKRAEREKKEFDFGPTRGALQPMTGTEVGLPEALARGAGSGATFGFLPRILGGLASEGAAEAAGLAGADIDPYAVGRQVTQEQRQRQQAAQQQHPYAYGGAEFAGGFATPLPVGGVVKGIASPFARRLAGGALAGGAGGAISTFGHEEGLPSVPQVAINTGLGAGLGAALPAVGSALARPVRYGLEKLGVGRLPIARDVEQEAASEIGQARQEADIERGAVSAGGQEPSMLPESAVGAPEHPQAMTIDVLGESGRDLARAAANLSPAASGTLKAPLYARRGSQLERYEQELPQTSTEHLGERREQLGVANPETTRAYNIAREIGDGRINLQSDAMQQLTQMPLVQQAFRRLRFEIEDAHRAENLTRQGQGLPPRPAPTLQDLSTWDMVKRSLDTMNARALRASNEPRGRVITQVTSALRDELDRQVPEYAQARMSARADIMTRNALEEGAKFAKGGDIYETQQALAQMQQHAPQAVQAFQEGFTQALRQQGGKKATAGNLYAQVKESPDQVARMRVALGDQRTDALQALRERETVMQRALEAVTGNSTTARQLMNAARASGAGALGVPIAAGGAAAGLDYLLDLGQGLYKSGLATGAGAKVIATALNRRGVVADRQVANSIAQMLVSRDPQQLARLAMIANRMPPLERFLRSLGEQGAYGTARAAGGVVPEMGVGQ
jgi:hypothetical protein